MHFSLGLPCKMQIKNSCFTTKILITSRIVMLHNSFFSQKGNVLFLILIAVALFAALSYAISQTMRQGSGGVSEEKDHVKSIYVHQFPTSIRQAILRIKLSDHLADTDISFAHPGTVAYGVFGTAPQKEVFHPQGGAIPYQSIPAGVNDGSDWIFNGSLEIDGIGSTDGTGTGSDLVAFLPGISLDTCRYINKGFSGSLTTPVDIAVAGETTVFTGTFSYAATISDPALNGKAAFCYRSTTLNKYVYYEVLIER